jgi:hypothetical protein
LTLVRRRAAAGWAGLALLAAKLAWEQGVGAVPGSSGFIGGHTIVDAHLYGALGGGLGALLPPARRPARPDRPA